MMQFMQGRYGADQTDAFGSQHGVSDHFPVFQKSGMVLAGGDRNRLQLFPDVFQKYFKALRGKPEISEDDGGNPEKACFLEIPACTAQNLPYLQMPWLQTENPCAQGARQNRNPLS